MDEPDGSQSQIVQYTAPAAGLAGLGAGLSGLNASGAGLAAGLGSGLGGAAGLGGVGGGDFAELFMQHLNGATAPAPLQRGDAAFHDAFASSFGSMQLGGAPAGAQVRASV